VTSFTSSKLSDFLDKLPTIPGDFSSHTIREKKDFWDKSVSAFHEEIEKLQNECPHTNVTKIAREYEGSSPYWAITCADCDFKWTEDM